MKILDTTNGNIHEYGSSPHDSLEISEDGCALHYYNLQCGDGSRFGTYRFVMEDGKIPAESQTEDARYLECYFNIGGFDKRPHGEWAWRRTHIVIGRPDNGNIYCTNCLTDLIEDVPEIRMKGKLYEFCPNCGASMSKLQANGEQVKTNQWCKFKSEKNCDFCAFHSDCEIHWKDGDDE